MATVKLTPAQLKHLTAAASCDTISSYNRPLGVLDRLDDKGLLSRIDLETAPSGRTVVRYAITDAGRAYLASQQPAPASAEPQSRREIIFDHDGPDLIAHMTDDEFDAAFVNTPAANAIALLDSISEPLALTDADTPAFKVGDKVRVKADVATSAKLRGVLTITDIAANDAFPYRATNDAGHSDIFEADELEPAPPADDDTITVPLDAFDALVGERDEIIDMAYAVVLTDLDNRRMRSALRHMFNNLEPHKRGIARLMWPDLFPPDPDPTPDGSGGGAPDAPIALVDEASASDEAYPDLPDATFDGRGARAGDPTNFHGGFMQKPAHNVVLTMPYEPLGFGGAADTDSMDHALLALSRDTVPANAIRVFKHFTAECWRQALALRYVATYGSYPRLTTAGSEYVAALEAEQTEKGAA